MGEEGEGKEKEKGEEKEREEEEKSEGKRGWSRRCQLSLFLAGLGLIS